MQDSSGRRVGGVVGHLKFEQDLSKESGSNRGIFEEKTEESAVRTIESKGFLQTSPLPLGYRAPAPYVSVPAGKCPSGADQAGGQKTGAGDGGRTRDIDLGKVALYH